jgi:hypothetical protein
MKKCKRLLSLFLAFILAMTMLPTTLSAFAANPKTTITVYKIVKVDEGSWGALLPTEKFTVSMVPATEEQIKSEVEGEEVIATDAKGQEVEIGPALKNPTIEFDFDATDSTSGGSVEKSKDFKLEFDDDFTHTGIYRYYMTETADEDKAGYITYDTKEYTVDLYVQQNEADGSYFVADYVVTNTTTKSKPQKVSFENTIKCSDLTIAKAVEGVEYKQGEFYTFRILIPVGGTTITLEEGQTFEAEILDSSNNIVKDTANGRTNDQGKVIITVKGEGLNADMAENATEFKLKAGEKLKIIGAPVSMVYKVEEVTDTDQFKKEGYTVTYDYIEQGSFNADETQNGTNTTLSNQEGNSVTGTVNTGKNEVHFINTRNIETPTGIALEVLPYALAVLIAGCGIALFVYKKKRATR